MSHQFKFSPLQEKAVLGFIEKLQEFHKTSSPWNLEYVKSQAEVPKNFDLLLAIFFQDQLGQSLTSVFKAADLFHKLTNDPNLPSKVPKEMISDLKSSTEKFLNEFKDLVESLQGCSKEGNNQVLVSMINEAWIRLESLREDFVSLGHEEEILICSQFTKEIDKAVDSLDLPYVNKVRDYLTEYKYMQQEMREKQILLESQTKKCYVLEKENEDLKAQNSKNLLSISNLEKTVNQQNAKVVQMEVEFDTKLNKKEKDHIETIKEISREKEKIEGKLREMETKSLQNTMNLTKLEELISKVFSEKNLKPYDDTSISKFQSLTDDHTRIAEELTKANSRISSLTSSETNLKSRVATLDQKVESLTSRYMIQPDQQLEMLRPPALSYKTQASIGYFNYMHAEGNKLKVLDNTCSYLHELNTDNNTLASNPAPTWKQSTCGTCGAGISYLFRQIDLNKVNVVFIKCSCGNFVWITGKDGKYINRLDKKFDSSYYYTTTENFFNGRVWKDSKVLVFLEQSTCKPVIYNLSDIDSTGPAVNKAKIDTPLPTSGGQVADIALEASSLSILMRNGSFTLPNATKNEACKF